MGKTHKIEFGADLQEKVLKRFMLKVKNRLDILTWSITDFSIKDNGSYTKISRVFQQLIHEHGIQIRVIYGNPMDTRLVQSRFIPIGVTARLLEKNHSKLILMDDTLAYLGSGNFTGSGIGSDYDKTYYNLEVSILLWDHEDLNLLDKYFTVLWKHAKPVT